MSKTSKLTVLLSSFTVLLCCYYLIYVAPFFPNQNGGLGHDYALWFPRMLAGDYYTFSIKSIINSISKL